MLKRSAILSLFVLCFIGKSIGATYYVDNLYGNDSNNGLSSSAAWKSLTKVNAKTFSPGDYILFKRGGIWYGTLSVRNNGTSSSRIVYGAYGSGNNPRIDGSNTRSNTIYIYSKHYVTIKNLKLQNAVGSGQILIANCSNIRIENNQFYVTGHGGIFIENSSYCVIDGNSITTPSGYYNKQTDGIYSQNNSGNTYSRNSMIITNSHATQHVDGIQSYRDNNLTIKNNFIYQNNTKTNSQGIYTTVAKGTHYYFNNIINAPNTISAVVGFRNLSSGTGNLRLYHNTLIGKGGNILYVTENPGLVAKNNIFIAIVYQSALLKLTTISTPSNINYNLYYNGGGTKAAMYNGYVKTLAQMKSMGFESKGIMGSPKLESNYRLKSGSAAINKGVNLGSSYQYDRGGSLRPQMSYVDMGAYESSFLSKEETEIEQIPGVYELSQNYPNPFNPTTRIRFSLPETSEVTLTIYDILGKEVATLMNETKNAGTYEVPFNASQFASGVYVYRLKTPNFVQTKKMSLIK
jgi:parallel beta-helix repeat protein